MHSRLKALFFWLILLVFTWLAVELCSLAAWSVLNRGIFSYAKITAQLDATTTVATAPVSSHSDLKWGNFSEVLHPYFGYVADPKQSEPFWRVSDYGFILSDRPSPILKRAPDRVIVGVFGGSFANGAYLSLKDLLTQKFAGTGREVVVLNFANGGYKQPQQLLILNYLLAVGAEFDVVINLDGFNEVTLPSIENVPQHVNPFFPRSWNRRTADLVSAATLRNLGHAEVLKEQKEHWARLVRTRHLYLSPTVALLWQYRDRSLARSIYELNRAIADVGTASQTYASRGPAYEDRGEDALFHDLVDVWARCSLQMKSAAEATGARYFHFLQPNQYDKGSKPIGAEERRVALSDGNPFGHAVLAGYPLLRASGAKLKASGVAFVDLTQVFAHTPDPLYVDDCCHLKMEGYAVIADRIYDEISPALPRAPARPR